jgi:antitoxin component of MazEF toxin-antitoxin module
MPHEETRKIIKIGNTSYAVILPRAWLRFFGLTEKNKVTVLSNGTVTIKPLKKRET